MPQGREYLTEVFAELGRRLRYFGGDGASRNAIAAAMAENPWFTEPDIITAVASIRDRMLGQDALQQWLSPYPEVRRPRNVGVIMAGNIPLVGFFDMLCVLISGHNCHIKPSSKDRALVCYTVSLLKDIYPGLPVCEYTGQPIDAVIATGSDNARRYFRNRFGGITNIIRGNRASVAILTGNETDEQLNGLACDIFSYSGLGCRNVSLLLLPAGYDTTHLISVLSAFGPVHPKYANNFRQRSTVLGMQGEGFIKGPFFILRQSDSFPACISEIACSSYNNTAETTRWLESNDSLIQCVVHDAKRDGISHPRSAAFGSSQSPSLTDWPDGINIFDILNK